MAELSLAAVRVLMSRIARMEVETARDGTLAALRKDPDWLQLPPAKRDVALARHKALLAYDRKKEHTTAEAIATAAKLGIQVRSLYLLIRNWRMKGRSPFALVPYRSDETSKKRSRLDPAVAKHLADQVRALLEEDPAIAPNKAVRAIEAGWPARLKRPSAVTMRSFLERARGDKPPEPGSLRLAFGATGKEVAEKASGFGQVLVIDHTSTADLLIDGKAASAPTITLAVDLFSGVAIGAAVREGEPSPEGVLDALADARDRMDALGAGVPVQPRIIHASTTEPEWDLLRDRLSASGTDVGERRDHRLHFGGAIKRLIGSRLGTVALQASRARRSGIDKIDPEQDVLLTMNQMRFVIDSAVDRVIRERLLSRDEWHFVRLILPPSLDGRGGLKAKIRPLISIGDDGRGSSVDEPAGSSVHSRRPESVGEPGDPTFEASLLNVVKQTVGPDLVSADVNGGGQGAPGWVVRVKLNDEHLVAKTWLRLAGEALDIRETRGEMVRFEVS